MQSLPLNQRRYDLDWLRVIAFGLLIIYHIGMFYVSWGWHVKSVHASEAAEPFMIMLNPWRLSLLFLISGVAIRFAFDKAESHLRFTGRRTLTLFIPIVFGIHVIVAPQAWLQLLESGEIQKGFWQFYPEYLIGSVDRYSIQIPTWNHLWYVVYLMLYTLLLAPFARPLSRWTQNGGARIFQKLFDHRWGVVMVLLIPVLPHVLIRFTLDPIFPTTHDVINDWANHAHSTVFLLTGFLLAKDPSFWRAIERALKPTVMLAAVLAISLSLAWGNWEALSESEAALLIARLARVLYIWVCIAALLGLAQRYLNRPSKTLSYMTEAIFPWYILHQTLIVMAGYWLTRTGVTVWPEFLLLTLATFGGCYLINEYLIRRWRPIRPLFGLRNKPPRETEQPCKT
ncbi:MAG: acyltransferase family protein [Gammaproteobacteria bacterium]|nr:acyltransferase family protein [Gammaproteobacteria bacterium]